jgi:hypothetical protein
VQGADHLVEHVLVCASQYDRRRTATLTAVYVQHLTVTDANLADRIASTEALGIEGLVPLNVRHRRDDPSSRGLGEALEIFPVAPPRADDARLNEVLHAKVVDYWG